MVVVEPWLAKSHIESRVEPYHQRTEPSPLGGIPELGSALHDDAVRQTNPDFDALLVFLANWEAIEQSALGRILTAGQLADVQELERLYALPAESARHAIAGKQRGV